MSHDNCFSKAVLKCIDIFFLELMVCIILLTRMCSMNLLIIQVRETGL